MRAGFALRFRLLAALVWLVAVAGFATQPRADEPVLTVAGLAETNEITLSVDELRQMGSVDLRTGTPWTEGVSTFTGITGRRFVEVLQASGNDVIGVAINDYHVLIPFDVFNSDSLLIAFARDGAAMSVREKGPIWVVFPFDDDPLYRSDTYRAYSIWSLTHLEFR